MTDIPRGLGLIGDVQRERKPASGWLYVKSLQTASWHCLLFGTCGFCRVPCIAKSDIWTKHWYVGGCGGEPPPPIMSAISVYCWPHLVNIGDMGFWFKQSISWALGEIWGDPRTVLIC